MEGPNVMGGCEISPTEKDVAWIQVVCEPGWVYNDAMWQGWDGGEGERGE